MGLMVVNFCSLLLLTHSLLMKRPVGWMYFLPFGAVSSTERSDIVFEVKLNRLQRGTWSAMVGLKQALEGGRRADSGTD